MGRLTVYRIDRNRYLWYFVSFTIGKEGKVSVRSIKSDFSGDVGKGDVANLINGYNITTSDSNMYLLPF